MKFCPECGFEFTTGTEKFCLNCGYDVNKGAALLSEGKNKNSIHIERTGGDVVGIGVTGSGNIIGKEITINKTTYNKLEPEFRNSLRDFLALINRYSEKLSEEQRKSLKESLDGLAKAVEGLKAGQAVKDDETKDEIKSKQITLAEKIVEYLPQFAELIASVTPLAPISKVIGEGTEYFAEWIRRKLTKKH